MAHPNPVGLLRISTGRVLAAVIIAMAVTACGASADGLPSDLDSAGSRRPAPSTITAAGCGAGAT